MKVDVFPLQTLHKGALCLLLCVELKNHKLQIMLDCGLSQQLDLSIFRAYGSKISKSKLILLSQASLEYAGGIPFVFAEHQIPALATSPVVDFALRNFIDQLINVEQAFIRAENEQEEQKWVRIIDQAEEAYSQIKRLNLGQQEKFTFDGLFEVSVVPVRAGKLIGCCAWKIQVNNLNIIYMTDFNMQRELHVDSLNIEKLFIRNQKQNLSLHKEQIDLLIIDTYPISQQGSATPQQDFQIKNTIEEQLRVYFQQNNQKGQLIFAFYPNERILEGVMSIVQIYQENASLKNLKWEVLSNYNDLVEKAGGFTEFLGNGLVNWKHKETNYQSPFDPEYIKATFQTNKAKRANVLLMGFNTLFQGPLYQESFLGDPHNTVVIFGTPQIQLAEGMAVGKLKNGEVNLQVKDSISINLNYLKKLLVKKGETSQKESKNLNAPSTTYLPGSTQDQLDSQSENQGKSMEKLSDDDLQDLDDLQEPQNQLPIILPSEPLFNKPNYKQHPLYIQADKIAKENTFFSKSANPLRPMAYLFIKDDFGVEIPSYLEELSKKKLQKAMKDNMAMEEEQETSFNARSKLQENNFHLPKASVRPRGPAQINAKILNKQLQQNSKNTKMLLEYLNPQQVLLLTHNNKIKEITKHQLLLAKVDQNQPIKEQPDGQMLPFVEIEESERCIVMQVEGNLKLHHNRSTNSTHQLLKLTCTQSRTQIQSQIQLLALFERLQKRKDIQVQIGFTQIQINGGQLIITRNREGFQMEGHYCALYLEVRNIIRQLNIL